MNRCPATLALLMILGCFVTRPAGASEPENPYPLWDASRPVPERSRIPQLEGVRFRTIKARRPEVDGFNWLHGVAVAWHKDRLYASFGLNQGAENTASEIAAGRLSIDKGRAWSPTFTIDPGGEANTAVSHGVLLSRADELWAFHGEFDGKMRNVRTRAYTLDEPTGHWVDRGLVVEGGFWPMQEPIRMDNGNYIMAGLRVRGGYGGTDDPAAVAISRGEDLTEWDLRVIGKPEDMTMWGESTVLVDGSRVFNISRYGDGSRALVAVSEDYGETWTDSRPSNLPMTTSKPYAGTLSTGQHYLIATCFEGVRGERAPLTIAVTEPGDMKFTRLYTIREAVHDGPGESDPGARLGYPYAVEREGYLYVAYSNDGDRGGNRNSAELAIIPIERLRAK